MIGRPGQSVRGIQYPAMFGSGPGIEQDSHKIGECMDSREMSARIAFLAGYAGVLRGGE